MSQTPLVVLHHSKDCTPSLSFEDTLRQHHLSPLKARTLNTLQINVGKLCNQICHHCHVDAGPHRTEIMTKDTMDHILRVLAATPSITTVDLTGGAPEMNPHFEYFVKGCKMLGRTVLDRCNLTVFYVKGKDHLPEFLADQGVEIIASLPCYQEDNVDTQRGKGVFGRSIAALQHLNALGYGKPGSGLVLNLVYNPLGPKLPPPQLALESDYKEELNKHFGIQFNRLFTITNMPISRFLEDLVESGQLDDYYTLLVNSFNPASVEGLMCRSLLSVGWDGRLYDCDFNQMLDLPLHSQAPQHLGDFSWDQLHHRTITVRSHCLGCTAGSGSSCGGTLV
ncbi:MAG: arsenosugar biosynthesis radical SAM protein ArsS [Nitrospira sp.]|nr:arsenosugar biosynthesis radical SAM protein ArsS [Nitrospira sp.]MCA9479500.1 arsenosugar biosynthesis radical SAM protein ArsS [Nitrospira sp.]MCB9710288.1 arsenosugar biosynthesis radical SAM protein ArsS [Nitrospiraceae bacterium]